VHSFYPGSQRANVEKLCRSRGADALEYELGPESRSVFDSVIASGCVDFSLKGEATGDVRDYAPPNSFAG